MDFLSSAKSVMQERRRDGIALEHAHGSVDGRDGIALEHAHGSVDGERIVRRSLGRALTSTTD